jgi:hypothetical protein
MVLLSVSKVPLPWASFQGSEGIPLEESLWIFEKNAPPGFDRQRFGAAWQGSSESDQRSFTISDNF